MQILENMTREQLNVYEYAKKNPGVHCMYVYKQKKKKNNCLSL